VTPMPSTSFRHIKTAFPESSSLDQVLSKFLTHLYNLLACSWITIDMSWKSFLKDLSRNLSLTWKDSTWFRHSTTESCNEVISLCKLDTTSSLSAIFCLKTIPKEDRNEIGNHQQNRLFLKEHQLARVLEQLQPVDLQALLNQSSVEFANVLSHRVGHFAVFPTQQCLVPLPFAVQELYFVLVIADSSQVVFAVSFWFFFNQEEDLQLEERSMSKNFLIMHLGKGTSLRSSSFHCTFNTPFTMPIRALSRKSSASKSYRSLSASSVLSPRIAFSFCVIDVFNFSLKYSLSL
jgi:hypothetical protein